MKHLFFGIVMTIVGALVLLRCSYYFLIKDKLVKIPMEVVKVEQIIRRKIKYQCTYKYYDKDQEKYYHFQTTSLRKVGDVDMFYIDPRFHIVFDGIEWHQNVLVLLSTIILFLGIVELYLFF